MPRLKSLFLIFLLGFVTCGLWLAAPKALAAVDLKAEFPVAKFANIGELASVLLSNIYVVAGVVFLFMVVITGLSYIFGAGNESPQKIQATQQTLLWTLVGLLVIIASYWIVQAIGVLTGFKILP